MTARRIRLEAIAERGNLAAAVERAMRGKRHRPEVVGFLDSLEANLAELGGGILDGTLPLGVMTEFRIRGPKPRIIHAPCFRERVLHHAIMAHVGPILDRGLVDNSFACRVGKGTLAAVRRTQEHVRRFAWYAKMDVRSYFATVDHDVLKAMLARRFRAGPVIPLLNRIIHSHETAPGKGLPIGSLMSQALANFYLNPLDRFLLESQRVLGLVRYMDDILIWDRSRLRVTEQVWAVREFLHVQLALTMKEPFPINRSRHGVTVCGYRIHAGTILLAASRKRRFREARRYWEGEYRRGRIDALQLQRGMDSALSIIAHADAQTWRKRQFARHTPQVLDEKV
jgi:RNA-directed DNA polymerase